MTNCSRLCGLVFVLTIACCFFVDSVVAETILPAGTLSGKQIESVFSGNTVSATTPDGKDQALVRYFSADGKLEQADKGFLSQGKWWLRDDDRLCVELDGGEKDCRIIVADGDQYRQYAVKLDGSHRHELTYATFRSGKHLAALSAYPLLPPGTLNRQQVIDLFSGKTVESVTVSKGRVSLTYYDPAGTLEQSRSGRTRYGVWRVTSNGRICIQMENLQEKCRIIVHENGSYEKYIVKRNGRHQHSVSYRHFKPGRHL